MSCKGCGGSIILHFLPFLSFATDDSSQHFGHCPNVDMYFLTPTFLVVYVDVFYELPVCLNLFFNGRMTLACGGGGGDKGTERNREDFEPVGYLDDKRIDGVLISCEEGMQATRAQVRRVIGLCMCCIYELVCACLLEG